jgi:uncharacterized protein
MKDRATMGSGAARRVAGVLPCAAVLLLAACSIPIPQAENDPTRFYVLSAAPLATSAHAAPAPAPAPPQGGKLPAVHLRQVEVASYLGARSIIVRRGEHEIEFREFARWGESLDVGIGRVLREELLARGAAAAVLGRGLRAAGVDYDLELSVRVLACEGGADGTVLFRAAWELATAGAAAEPVARGDYRAGGLQWDGTSEASLVAQLSQAVTGLAAEIAAELKN